MTTTSTCPNPGCMYGQIFDYILCQCQCDQPNGFSGILCENINCTQATDSLECQVIGCPLGSEYSCPLTCNLCPTTPTTTITTKTISTTTATTLKPCYIGCYNDNTTNRVLNGLGATTSNIVGGGSIQSCTAYCKAGNYTYAGVQFG